MKSWASENLAQKNKLAAELLGRLYAQAALAECISLDQGQGFNLNTAHLRGVVDINSSAFGQLFSQVDAQMLAESESLQSFAKVFGYSASAVGQGAQKNWAVQFKRAV